MYLTAGLPTLYRGGDSMACKPHEVKEDKITNLLKTTHGVSVDAVAEEVARFGGAYRIRAIPDELNIIQRGRRREHYEIVPGAPMSAERYQELLDQVDLELFLEQGE